MKGGELPESRIDESARRILRVLFALGLFEDPYVSPDEAGRTVRKAEFQAKADLAQRRSIVLLKNAGNLLPLRKGGRIYVEGVDPAVGLGAHLLEHDARRAPHPVRPVDDAPLDVARQVQADLDPERGVELRLDPPRALLHQLR